MFTKGRECVLRTSPKCAACNKKVTTDKAVASENGRLFCCQAHHDWFFAGPDKPPLDPRKAPVVYRRTPASVTWGLLAVFLLCLGVFLWDGVKLWLGKPVDVVLFVVMTVSLLSTVIVYGFIYRWLRAFEVVMAHREPGMSDRDFAGHLERLYRKKQLSKRELLWGARQISSPELAAVVRKIRSGEIR
ncbi:hypothetical protein SAMN05877962_101264 [Alloalcanivorax xenomutans]|nr:hypothetical protein SAMN05877962_101264 [Alloalcanivorax xenomutans]